MNDEQQEVRVRQAVNTLRDFSEIYGKADGIECAADVIKERAISAFFNGDEKTAVTMRDLWRDVITMRDIAREPYIARDETVERDAWETLLNRE